MITVQVRDNNIDQATRLFKKKMQRAGIYRAMKQHTCRRKPCEKRNARKAEAIRRIRKLNRKRLERQGF